MCAPHLKVPPSADDPSSDYASLDLEMIARAPILLGDPGGTTEDLEVNGPFDPTFLTDAIKVNEILAIMIRPTPAWVYMKPKRGVAPNGRRSYMLIFAHFLGPGNMDHLAGRASQRLQNLEWSRNTQTWNWDDYVAAHMTEHNIIEGLVVHGYTWN